MATKTVRIDDLDGTEGAETIIFSLDGQSYEIDLSEKNAAKLRGALDPFIDGGARKVGGRSSKSATPLQQIARPGALAWAKEQGLVGPDHRGRLSKDVIEAYDAAH